MTRPGMDLSKVTLPTFVLEPRSMLERITNFMSHPELLLDIPSVEDPEQRFLDVCRFYLSGWHLKPKGVKKPLNPVLGENFRCKWLFPERNNTEALYISEQVSHHPPISAYFYFSPQHNIRIDGVLKPRSKFLGNSAGTIMEGKAVLTLLNRPGEKYELTQPNMYARGILFGKMKFELGDHSYIRCDQNNLVAEIEFKTKGFISGTYNAITGKWDEEMSVKNLKTGKKIELFNAKNANPTYCSVRPLEEQESKESQKLWGETCEAVKRRDQDKATQTKSAIEDHEREERRERERKSEKWQPRFFSQTGEEDYIFKLEIDSSKSPEEQLRQVEEFSPVSEGSGVSPSRPPQVSRNMTSGSTAEDFHDAPELSDELAKAKVS